MKNLRNEEVTYNLTNPRSKLLSKTMNSVFTMPKREFDVLWETSHNPLFIVFLYSLTLVSIEITQGEVNSYYSAHIPFIVENTARYIQRKELNKCFSVCREAEDNCINENNKV